MMFESSEWDQTARFMLKGKNGRILTNASSNSRAKLNTGGQSPYSAK